MQNNTPAPSDFYLGAPLEPEDLWYREAYIDELWETLRRQHVLIAAPRRTGKTSVMNHLLKEPRDEFMVIYQNVQDLSHPADLFQTILDNFNDAHPEVLRQMAKNGYKLLADAIGSLAGAVESLDAGGFKIGLRHSATDWRSDWRKHGDVLFAELRRLKRKVLLIVDELPDMLLNMRAADEALVREFLGWFRTHRQTPLPTADSLRWLIGGSINLTSTLDDLGKVDSINDLAIEPLPVLTPEQVRDFVTRMLTARQVPFEAALPGRMVERLGRPIPLFLQMATQDLFRSWRLHPRTLGAADVDTVFENLVTGLAAQDKLQHYHSRIDRYYREPCRAAAHEILSKLSQSGPGGLSRRALEQEFSRTLGELGHSTTPPVLRKDFNHLMRDMDNDFYISAVDDDHYDFASGLMKAWWKKYYA